LRILRPIKIGRIFRKATAVAVFLAFTVNNLLYGVEPESIAVARSTLAPVSIFSPVVKLAWDTANRRYDISEDPVEMARLINASQEGAAIVYLNILMAQFARDLAELSEYGVTESGLAGELKKLKTERLTKFVERVGSYMPGVDLGSFIFSDIYLDDGSVCLPHIIKDPNRIPEGRKIEIIKFYPSGRMPSTALVTPAIPVDVPRSAVKDVRLDFTADRLLSVQNILAPYIKETPLIYLPEISAMKGKKVFIKDESRQNGDSFKARGVTYEVFYTIEDVITHHPERLKKGVKIVTQTVGNHGAAMIHAVTSAIKHFEKKYHDSPELLRGIRNIEPVVYSYSGIASVKLGAMEEALAEYREYVGDQEKGNIRYKEYADYDAAKTERIEFIKRSEGVAFYMEHGGIEVMQGHATAGIEIDKELAAAGVGDEKKVCLLIPVGAGGPIGVAAALKAMRELRSAGKNVTAVMVQTPRYGAFVESYRTGLLAQNSHGALETVTLSRGGRTKRVIYEDGIAVDGPESQTAVDIARAFLDDAVIADPQSALDRSAPLLLKELDAYYQMIDGSAGVVGGTTAIALEALFAHGASCAAIRDADALVILGTEGRVDDDIMLHTRASNGFDPVSDVEDVIFSTIYQATRTKNYAEAVRRLQLICSHVWDIPMSRGGVFSDELMNFFVQLAPGGLLDIGDLYSGDGMLLLDENGCTLNTSIYEKAKTILEFCGEKLSQMPLETLNAEGTAKIIGPWQPPGYGHPRHPITTNSKNIRKEMLKKQIAYLLSKDAAECVNQGNVLLMGPGMFTHEVETLISALPGMRSLTIVDPSARNLAVLKASIDQMDGVDRSKIYLKQAGFDSLPFADGTFDMVYSNACFDSTLPWIDESEFKKWISELKRVMRGHAIYVTDHSEAGIFINAGLKVMARVGKGSPISWFFAAKTVDVFSEEGKNKICDEYSYGMDDQDLSLGYRTPLLFFVPGWLTMSSDLTQTIAVLAALIITALVAGKYILPGRSWSIKAELPGKSLTTRFIASLGFVAVIGLSGWFFSTFGHHRIIFSAVTALITNISVDIAAQYMANKKIDLSQTLASALFVGGANGLFLHYFYEWLVTVPYLERVIYATLYTEAIGIAYTIVMMILHNNVRYEGEKSERADEFTHRRVWTRVKAAFSLRTAGDFVRHMLVQAPFFMGESSYFRVVLACTTGSALAIFMYYYVNIKKMN